MLTHSVESRFVAIICAALLVFVAPLFALFLALSQERTAAARHERLQIVLDANARALAKPLWDFDIEGARQIASTLRSDPDIRAVSVRDTEGTMSVDLAPDPALRDLPSFRLETDIHYDSLDGLRRVGSIAIEAAATSGFAAMSMFEVAILATFAVAVAILFLAAVIGNRLTIMRPLMRLTAAVEATRQLGARHHVDWTSADEMGHLARNFNAMQDRLAREEVELRHAHGRATDIYNRTPAMLFSTDRDGRLTAVSDYWLEATGYGRAEVIGRPFTDFLDEDDSEAYRERPDGAAGRRITDVTVKFRTASGRSIDVLILEAASEPEADAEVGGGPSLSVMTDVTRLKEAEARNLAQAIADHLTGLLNRNGFEGVLDTAIAAADRDGAEVACLFVDLDRFKAINDSLGHGAGDAVLREVVARMRAETDAAATLARLGGDEFAILIAAPEVESAALETAGRLAAALARRMTIGGADVGLSASIGVALYPRHAATAAELLQKADMAMYARKRDGKNGVFLFNSDLTEAVRRRREIETDIEAALREDWVRVHLQPIVHLADRRLAGFEALMRIDHPQKGLLPPAGVIAVAEDTGTIREIGNRILERAVRELAGLPSAAFGDAYLAVNLSPLQFEPGLAPRLARLLAETGIRPQRIVVEITEAVLMQDDPRVHGVLDSLRTLGCRIALDDFGTGYSSLSYLNRFPVDILKIDQSFVRAMSDGSAETRRKSRMLIEGIRTISQQMNCVVVAEGVETEAQWDDLRDIGVDFGQGWFFGRPQPAAAIAAAHAERDDRRDVA